MSEQLAERIRSILGPYNDDTESIQNLVSNIVVQLDEIKAAQAQAGDGEAPVAVRFGWDGDGYQYMDNGSGSDWLTRNLDAEKLYLKPQPWLTQEPVAYWNKDYVFASFIKLADHLEYEEGEPPEGWVPLYLHPQPAVNQQLLEARWIIRRLLDEAVDDVYYESDPDGLIEEARAAITAAQEGK